MEKRLDLCLYVHSFPVFHFRLVKIQKLLILITLSSETKASTS